MKKLSKLNSIFILGLLALPVFILGAVFLVEARERVELPAQYRPGELLIKFKESDQIHKFKFDQREELDPIIESYEGNDQVEIVDKNAVYRLTRIPNDTKYFRLWHLAQIQAPAAWDITTGSEEVTVAVIDTGVVIDHPDLKNNIWVNPGEIPGDGIDNDQNGYIDDVNGWDFITETPDPGPKLDRELESLDSHKGGLNHGTVISGVIAAEGNNAEGIAGVSWRSKIMPLRMLDSNGFGDLEDLIEAVNYAINNGADIINFSFVGSQQSDLLDQVLLKAYNAGILIVAAAGNEQINGQALNLDEVLVYPVCSNYNLAENVVIGVGATDTLDQAARFSGFGNRCLDINAPGYALYSTQYQNPEFDLNDLYGGGWSGTSLSTPIVSGAAALLKSVNRQFTVGDITDYLLRGGDSIDDINPSLAGSLGFGRLNLKKSLELSVGKQLFTTSDKKIIVTPIDQSNSEIAIFDLDFNLIVVFQAYPFSFAGGVNIAPANFGNDAFFEIITAPGKGGGPHVLIFDEGGNLRGQFFAYDPQFTGGVQLAIGDVNGDGEDEIITGPGSGLVAEIKIFDKRGQILSSFTAFEGFSGGVNLAAGDLDGDGTEEIIVAADSGLPRVGVYNIDGQRLALFNAYAEGYNRGVLVTTGDIDGDNQAEIITGAKPGGGPHIRIFDRLGGLKGQFFDGNADFRGGVFVDAGDLDDNGVDEIIAGAGPGKQPLVSFYDSKGALISEKAVFDIANRAGVRVRLIR